MTDATSPAGRPRDLRLDGVILAATRALVVEHGYNSLSLAAVAERAGTTTAAIYRRWSGKAELVHEAVIPTEASEPAPLTGDTYADVRAIVVGACEVFGRPEVRVALPGLIADTLYNPELHSRTFGRLLERFAAARGDDATETARLDFPNLVEAIAGAAMFHVVFSPGAVLDDGWIDTLTEMFVNGYQPDL